MDWLVLAGAAAEAVSQVLVIVACGILLSRAGYLSESAQKAISRVNLYFLTPCLLFTKIASTINWEQFKAYWPIPVFYLIFSFTSWTVAKLGSRLFRFSKDEEKFVTASILFSNTNSLPMALLQSLAFSAAGDRLLRDETDTRQNVAARGISYILFYAIFGNLVRWSYGFSLLVPKDKDQTQSAAQSPQPLQSVLINIDSHPSLDTGSSSHTKQQPAVRQSSSLLHPPSSSAPPRPGTQSPALSTKSATESILFRAATTTYERIRQVLTPPLLTALIALIIGLVPTLHELFMSPESILYRFVMRPIEDCGGCAIPLILLCLGAQVMHFAKPVPATPPMSAPTLTIQKPVPTRPRGSTDLPAGLGIYTDETSSDDDDQSLARPNSGATYGSDFAKHRSYASSSATLLPVNSSSGQPQPFSSDETSTDAAERRPRVRRSGSASSTVSEESTDEEVMPLLRGARRENVSNAMKHKNEPSAHGHRFGCVTPISFILVSRMLLVPLICMPAILFHPETLSPILTTDPTFPLALVLINAAPTAINLAQLCQVKGFFEKPMAKVLFWSYCVFGIPSVLGWSLIGLWAAGRE